jgi:hypothetical protein
MHLSYLPGVAEADGAGGSEIVRRNLLGQVFHRILPKVLLDLVDGPF